MEGQKKGKVIKFGWIEGVYVSLMFYTIFSVKQCNNVLDAMSPQYLGCDALPSSDLGDRPVWDM